MHFDTTFTERFWSKVDRSGGNDSCWLWTAATLQSGGYGVVSFRHAPYRAHRVAWELANGREIPFGLHVLHSCDNPPCCNPAHLRIGTNTENIRDRMERGRSKGGAPFGERNSRSKLTDTDVIAIRASAQAGSTIGELSESYNVTRQAIWLIVTRKNWRHI